MAEEVGKTEDIVPHPEAKKQQAEASTTKADDDKTDSTSTTTTATDQVTLPVSGGLVSYSDDEEDSDGDEKEKIDDKKIEKKSEDVAPQTEVIVVKVKDDKEDKDDDEDTEDYDNASTESNSYSSSDSGSDSGSDSESDSESDDEKAGQKGGGELVDIGVIEVDYTLEQVESWTKTFVSDLGKARGNDLENLVSKLSGQTIAFALGPVLEGIVVKYGIASSRVSIKSEEGCENALKKIQGISSFSFSISEPLRYFLTHSVFAVIDKVLNLQYSFYSIHYVQNALFTIAQLCGVLAFYVDPECPRTALLKQRAEATEEEKKAMTPAKIREEDKKAIANDVTFQMYRVLERIFDSNKRFYKTHDTTHVILVKVINSFFDAKGFSRMTERIVSPTAVLTPEDVQVMLRPVELVRPWLKRAFISEFVDKLIDRLYARICDFSIKDFEGLDRDLVASMLRSSKTVVQGASVGGEEKALMITLHLIDLLLHLPQLDMRVLGVRELTEMIKASEKPPYGAAPGAAMSIADMIEWLQKHDIVKLLFDVSTTHPEIEKRSDTILSFLVCNHAFSEQQLDCVWNCATKPGVGDALQGATFDIIVSLSTSFSDDLWQHMDSLFSKLDVSATTASTSELFHTFLAKFLDTCISSKRFSALGEEGARWTPPCCLCFVWNTLMVECKEATILQQTTSLLMAFCKALLSNQSSVSESLFSDPMCQHFLNNALDGITEGSNAVSSLTFLAVFFREARKKMRMLKKNHSFIAETLRFVSNTNLIDTVIATMEKAVGSPNDEETVVKRCFEFLRSALAVILTSYESFSTMVDRLWNLLANHKTLRPHLFEFLLPQLENDDKDSVMYASELHVLTDALQKLDVSCFGEHEWEFFHDLFCDINETEDLLIFNDKDQSYELASQDNINLIAMDTFWYIALGAEDEVVATTARNFLLNLVTQHSRGLSRGMDQVLRKCLDVIRESTLQCVGDEKEKKRLACLRALLFVDGIIRTENNRIAFEKAHLSLSKSMPFYIKLRPLHGAFPKLVEVCGGDTVEHIRDIALSEFYFADPSRVYLVGNKQRMEDGRMLFEYGIHSDSLVVAMESTKGGANGPKQQPKRETQLLSGVLVERETYDLLFNLLKNPLCESSEILETVFEILCMIPTESGVLSKTINNGKDAALYLTELASAPAQVLLYALMCIDAMITGKGDNASKWCDDFVVADGINVLLKLIGTASTDNAYTDKALLLALSAIEKLSVGNEIVCNTLHLHGDTVLSLLMKRILTMSSAKESLATVGVCRSAFALIRTIFLRAEANQRDSLFGTQFLEWLYTILVCDNSRARSACVDFIVEVACPAKANPLFLQILNTLLSKLNSLPSMTNCNEFSRCVCTLLDQYRRTENAPDCEPTQCSNDVSGLVAMITQRPVIEKRDFSVCDVQLGAMLRILNALLFKPNYVEVATNSGIIKELFVHCLMEIPTKENHGDLAPPKCKSVYTRTSAFELLKKIIEMNESAAAEVSALAETIVDTYKDRYIKWRYEPAYSKRAECGFSGLINLGCTCYMNSVLQQVFMTSAFRNQLLQLPRIASNEDDEEDDEEGAEFGTAECEKLVPRLQSLFSRMIASERISQETKAFVCTLTHDGQAVNPYEQMDAEEFLTYLLDKIEDYAKACGKESIVRDTFYGCFARQMIPDGCEHKRESDEQFISLQLDVNGKKNVEDSLASFFESEVFSDYLCEQCNQRYDTTRRCRIKRLPQTLFVQCKRFEFDMDTMRRFKLTDEFVFPNKLDLSKYMKEGVPAPDYTLVGVVVHSGTADSGHYYSYIRDRASPEEKWYWFNDGSVQPFDPSTIPQECYGGEGVTTQFDPVRRQNYQTKAPKIHSAYLLVYEQLDKNGSQDRLQQSEQFISPKLFDSIWTDNEVFLRDLSVFDSSFFDCVITSVEKHIAALLAHKDACSCADDTKMVDDNETKHRNLSEQLNASTKVLTQLVFSVMVHSAFPKEVKRAVAVLCRAYELLPLLSSWFLDECAKTQWIEDVMSKCTMPKIRAAVLNLMPIVFVHACKEHSDIINKYNDLTDDSMEDGEDLPKKKEMEEQDPLLKDWPHGEAASPVTRFMDSYLKRLRTLARNWRTFKDYFGVIEKYADIGPKEREYLLSRHTVGMLVDLYLNENSPVAKHSAAKREPMSDKKSAADFTKLFDALYACVVDIEPLSAYFDDSIQKGVKSSPLLPPLDRDLLICSDFIKTMMNKETSPGVSKILCSCCAESFNRTKTVVKSAMNHLSYSDYYDLVLLLCDLHDSLQVQRIELIVNELAVVTATPVSSTAYSSWYHNNSTVTDEDKGEAVRLMAELVDRQKTGTTVVDCVYALRDKWLPSCLISSIDPIVRECSYLLLCRCMQLPATVDFKESDEPKVDEERASAVLASLMNLISVAENSVLPPTRDPKKEYHENYDYRLLEFARAVRYCLVGEKQVNEFGSRIGSYAELLAKLDAVHTRSDKSKWTLFETLMVALRDKRENLGRLLDNVVFMKSLRSWTLDYLADVDKDVLMYCKLVDTLSHANPNFLIGYMKKGSVFDWMVVNIASRAKQFPESSAAIMSLLSYAMSVPEAARAFVEGFIELAVSKLDWRECMTYVSSINTVKQLFDETMTNIFWSEGCVKSVIDSMRNNTECFIALCKVIALFAHGCPERMKPSILRYCLACHNMFKYEVSEKPYEGSPMPEEMELMDSDLDAILQAFCPDWQSGSLHLFSAFVDCPIDTDNSPNSMLVNSNAVDRTVRRLFDQSTSATASADAAAKSSLQVLMGMCIAYVAMCDRKIPSLPQFVADIRARLQLKPEDPQFNFGAERIANGMIISIDSDPYCEEAESLLFDCFAKSVDITVSDPLRSRISDAMKYVVTCTGVECKIVLQKLCILAHSSVIARLLSPYERTIEIIAEEAGKSGEKYFSFIINAIKSVPPPSYDEHIQKQQQQQMEQQNGKDSDDDDDIEDSDDDDDDGGHQTGPVGLPPSDMN